MCAAFRGNTAGPVHHRLQREDRAEAPRLEQEWVSLGLSWRGAEGKPSWVQPSGAHLGFVQDKQETKLGFLNAWHGSEAERQAGRLVPCAGQAHVGRPQRM